jgi:LysM repeat protein
MKKSELKEFLRNEIISVLSEVSTDDVETQKAYNDELEKTAELSKEAGLTEEEEEEPSTKDLKSAKKDSVSKIANKLQQTTKEMKAVLNKWKDAEGTEKDKLTSRLKELTKIKKELEGLL